MCVKENLFCLNYQYCYFCRKSRKFMNMKKVVTLILLAFVGVCSFSQNSSEKNQTSKNKIESNGVIYTNGNWQPATCMSNSSNVVVESQETGTRTPFVRTTDNNAWIQIRNVFFSEDKEAEGCQFGACVKGSGTIEVRIDDLQSKSIVIRSFAFENGEWMDIFPFCDIISGLHDVYICFSDKDMCLVFWQFFNFYEVDDIE